MSYYIHKPEELSVIQSREDLLDAFIAAASLAKDMGDRVTLFVSDDTWNHRAGVNSQTWDVLYQDQEETSVRTN